MEQLHWLAGLLEAAGSFDVTRRAGTNYVYPRVRIHHSDEEIVARVAEGWGVKYFRIDNSPGLATFQAQISGAQALRAMFALQPLLGTKRRGQIESVVATVGPKYITKMEALGRMAA